MTCDPKEPEENPLKVGRGSLLIMSDLDNRISGGRTAKGPHPVILLSMRVKTAALMARMVPGVLVVKLFPWGPFEFSHLTLTTPGCGP